MWGVPFPPQLAVLPNMDMGTGHGECAPSHLATGTSPGPALPLEPQGTRGYQFGPKDSCMDDPSAARQALRQNVHKMCLSQERGHRPEQTGKQRQMPGGKENAWERRAARESTQEGRGGSCDTFPMPCLWPSAVLARPCWLLRSSNPGQPAPAGGCACTNGTELPHWLIGAEMSAQGAACASKHRGAADFHYFVKPFCVSTETKQTTYQPKLCKARGGGARNTYKLVNLQTSPFK